jgi:hypothetical protein
MAEIAHLLLSEDPQRGLPDAAQPHILQAHTAPSYQEKILHARADPLRAIDMPA